MKDEKNGEDIEMRANQFLNIKMYCSKLHKDEHLIQHHFDNNF